MSYPTGTASDAPHIALSVYSTKLTRSGASYYVVALSRLQLYYSCIGHATWATKKSPAHAGGPPARPPAYAPRALDCRKCTEAKKNVRYSCILTCTAERVCNNDSLSRLTDVCETGRYAQRCAMQRRPGQQNRPYMRSGDGVAPDVQTVSSHTFQRVAGPTVYSMMYV